MTYRPLIILLACAMISCPLWATSSLNVGPLFDVDELSIQVSIGGTMASDPETAVRLFGSDPAKEESFRQDLLEEVSRRLQEGGVRVSSAEDVVLYVSILGGKFTGSGCDRNFYSIEVRVCRSEESDCADRSLLGVASDAGLSASIQAAVTKVVDEFIEGRSDYRKTLPAEVTYYSENRRFAVTITPKKVDVARRGTGAVGAKDNRPRAYVYTLQPREEMKLVAELELVNQVVPGSALVSDDGRYLVTFDNWGFRGVGGDTVVIYRTDGTLIRSLSLEDVLTANDIEVLPQSPNFVDWGEGHSIDEDEQLLVLRIQQCTSWGACSEMPAEVALHLADGTLLRPARDLLPQPKVRLRSVVESKDQGRQAASDDPPCASQGSFSSAREVSFGRLQEAATHLALPPYTALARKARLQGAVTLELLVEDGAVACVRTLKGLPLGLTRVAREAALQWRFSPSPELAGPVRSVVAFDFSFPQAQPRQESRTQR